MDKYSLAIHASTESPWVHQLTKAGIMDDCYIHVEKFYRLGKMIRCPPKEFNSLNKFTSDAPFLER